MEKHEMTARELLMAFINEARRSDLHYMLIADSDLATLGAEHEYIDRVISRAAEYADKHPDELTLEPLGNNIYFDSKHKIVADEVVRVYMMELTQVGKSERETGDLMALGQDIANEFAAKAYPYNVDDVKCVRAQQFITKGHEVDAE